MSADTTISRRFVLLPSYVNLTRLRLHYRDLLTYITIRSFNNTAYDLCKPSYDSICKLSGLSRKFVSQSIKRLKYSGLLKVKTSPKKHVANEYFFDKVHAFSRIPYDIFDKEDLSSSEKAMLICLRQFFSDTLECMCNGITDMALISDMKYKTIYTQYKSLLKKGYIEEFLTPRRKRKTIKLTSKVNWICNEHKLVNKPPVERPFIYVSRSDSDSDAVKIFL